MSNYQPWIIAWIRWESFLAAALAAAALLRLPFAPPTSGELLVAGLLVFLLGRLAAIHEAVCERPAV